MIKNIIFDLDGVLVDTRDAHYEALNKAIKKIGGKQISYKDHINKFDGLPTKEKLQILNSKKKILKKNNQKIIIWKNKFTSEILKQKIKFNPKIYNLFQKLSKKHKIGIATNAIRDTLDVCLKKLKIKKFVKISLSNQEIKNPKPHPEIYMKAMLSLNAIPNQTLILEDSYVGRLAVKNSGAHLFPVNNLLDVKIDEINNFVKKINTDNGVLNKKNLWDDKELNIIIPMAGAGKRFLDAGFTFPKPLIEIKGRPMIQWVIDCININANYIFLIQKNHQEKYNISSMLNIMKPGCRVIEIDELTEGAACTVLLAKKFINFKKPLIICNSDQYFEWNSSKSIYNFKKSDVDGAILTFNAIHPRWSYAKLNEAGFVSEVAEKKVISNNATVGLYYWKFGSDFVKYSEKMITKNLRVNNEFYVCPVYNQAIEDGKKVIIENVKSMFGVGTPEDLQEFLKLKNLT